MSVNDMPTNAVERRPKSVKERASIHRILNEDTEKTASAEVITAAETLMRLVWEDENLTVDEDEDVNRKDDSDFIPVTDFTPVNPPANHQARQQRSPAARKPAVKKLKVKKPARKPARKPAKKPATEKVSVPVAAPPQEESRAVGKTSSGRIIKRRKIYEG
ncbi:MAG: hypothetical protein Q9193_001369 [Seirophora villosa]